MSWIRTPRLCDDPATSPALATALREWSAQAGESESVLRLEHKLSGPLATPVRAHAAAAKSSWLLGLSMATALAILALCFAEHEVRAPEHGAAAQPEAHRTHASSAVAGDYLGASPRDLASVGPVTVLYAMHR